jgi:hypothetical protein
MDHDRLFKELLSEFFFEFLDLFFPTLAARVDRSHAPVFLDKESFGEPQVDSRREMDLVARLQLRDEGEACFLVHLEHEGQDKGDLPARMFRYFSRLWDRHQLPIYPIALLSFAGRKVQPQGFSLHFHDLPALDFRYRTVQLNQLDWRAFVNQPNPVASALMARMKVHKSDRPRVKVQCLRLLATLRLEPAKSRLISRFVDAYLRLNDQEMRIFDLSLESLPVDERKTVMSYTTSWEEQGIKRGLEMGLQRGREEGLEQGQKMGLERGLEQGRLVGREEGREQGLRSGLQVAVLRLFGERAQRLLERLKDCDLPQLEQLQEQLAAGADLDDLERTAGK